LWRAFIIVFGGEVIFGAKLNVQIPFFVLSVVLSIAEIFALGLVVAAVAPSQTVASTGTEYAVAFAVPGALPASIAARQTNQCPFIVAAGVNNCPGDLQPIKLLSGLIMHPPAGAVIGLVKRTIPGKRCN
jgi:hypothetical protein